MKHITWKHVALTSVLVSASIVAGVLGQQIVMASCLSFAGGLLTTTIANGRLARAIEQQNKTEREAENEFE